MGFNLDFKIEDNLTDSQKKQLREPFLKDYSKEDLSALRGLHVVSPFEININHNGYADSR